MGRVCETAAGVELSRLYAWGSGCIVLLDFRDTRHLDGVTKSCSD